MKNFKLVAGIVAGTFILITGVSLFFVKSSPSNHTNSEELVLGAKNIHGSENSLVTIIEFSDFQCPACREVNSLLESLIETHKDQIRVIYHHFPLTSIHSNAISAANAAEAAAAQGKFWEYAAVLFEQQDNWSEIRNPQDLFVSYAQQIETPDIEKFRQEVSDQTYRNLILKDLRLGNSIGINSTPTFIVNGEKTSAAGLKLAVDKILSKPQTN